MKRFSDTERRRRYHLYEGLNTAPCRQKVEIKVEAENFTTTLKKVKNAVKFGSNIFAENASHRRQCDQIWRNIAILAKMIKSWAILKSF